MEVVILAGGFGTRLSEYTESIPKPMVTVGGRPILWHIMKTYASFGYTDFHLALGYKAEVIKEYFLHYRSLNADFTVDLANGEIQSHQIDKIDWKVTLVHTGLETMTGGRVKRMQPYIGNEPFLLTYGDGVANINETHHYEDEDGYQVDSTAPNATIVTNFKHEETINDAKRSIRIMQPQYVPLVVDEFKRLMAIS